ncbi:MULTISPECIES: putative mucin/carbohydrate-binding domain-containing protein [unclassified Spiroplasma]|uniref:putative mucin/carbohydrate-binding domain-containing protein n=1 Tax=unclassified Spiroplasma TaxID=2637901 RepID=UPI0030D31E99
MSAIKKIFTVPNLSDDEKITVATDYNSAVNTFLKDKNTLLVPVELKIAQKNKIPNIQKYLFKLNKLNNTMVFQGISDGYKGIIGLHSQDKVIKFDGNSEEIHYYFKHEMYYTIKIKNNLGELIKDIVITGDQNFAEIIKKHDLTNGIKYDENYQIEIIPAEGNRVQIFNNDKYQPLNGPKTYIIKNDNLVEIK